ncbi:MAG: alpha/beta fold hydrolase [Pseudomonadota bacterium]
MVSTILFVLKLALGAVCVIILALILLGGASHIIRMGSSPGFTLTEVEGERRLHHVCEGPEDAPFVLYDAGAFGIYADGWWLLQELKRDHRVCLYDRAGMGWSDPVPDGVEPSPDWHIEDMRRLRRALGSDAPFVLIGHSMAGIRLHAYANAYPEELLGLVFIDAARPQTMNTERIESFVPVLSGGLSFSGILARIGLAGGFAHFMPDELQLSGTPAKDKRRSISAVSHHKATKAELLAAVSAWPDASWRSRTDAESLPVFAYSNSVGGGANAPVAKAAETNTGIGGVTALPEESHVSLLNAANALKIAEDVRKITGGDSDG